MRKGFTLIEVLIVIITIGILATLLMPQIGIMVERTRTVEAKNMIGAFRTVLAAYYMESSSFPVTMTDGDTINTTLGSMIDLDKSHYNYDIANNGTTVTITAKRNTRDFVNTNQASTLAITIDGNGNVTTGNLSPTWANGDTAESPDEES